MAAIATFTNRHIGGSPFLASKKKFGNITAKLPSIAETNYQLHSRNSYLGTAIQAAGEDQNAKSTFAARRRASVTSEPCIKSTGNVHGPDFITEAEQGFTDTLSNCSKMLPKHTPCFLSPQSATLAVAFGGIVYGILVIVSSVVSLSTGHNYSTGTDDKSQMFKIIQYSTAGVGGLFVIFSGLLVYGVRSSRPVASKDINGVFGFSRFPWGNRFLHLPWLCWAAVQIFAIFVGAILVLVSLEVTASMMFALVFNMLVAAVFCYSFFVVLEHYRHLALLAQPDAVQYEKQMLRE